LKVDEFEVAEVFEVPLAFLMDPANHEERVFRYEGGERRFFTMPYPRSESAGPNGQGGSEAGGHHFIWGATAAMLRNLYRFLAA
jgi:hypothetical protein